MRATKVFFESFSEEIEKNSQVVYEIKENRPSSKIVVDLFSGIGGFALGKAEILKAMDSVEKELNTRDLEIESLKSQQQKNFDEIERMKAVLKEKDKEINSLRFAIGPSAFIENPEPIPLELQEMWDKEYEAIYEEEYRNEIIQRLEEATQRESELRKALEEKRNKEAQENGVEKLPMIAFIEYAETYFPASQNDRAKVLKEVLTDVYNRRLVSDEDYERLKKLGTKENPLRIEKINDIHGNNNVDIR